jgi:hypothetical protein
MKIFEALLGVESGGSDTDLEPSTDLISKSFAACGLKPVLLNLDLRLLALNRFLNFVLCPEMIFSY